MGTDYNRVQLKKQINLLNSFTELLQNVLKVEQELISLRKESSNKINVMNNNYIKAISNLNNSDKYIKKNENAHKFTKFPKTDLPISVFKSKLSEIHNVPSCVTDENINHNFALYFENKINIKTKKNSNHIECDFNGDLQVNNLENRELINSSRDKITENILLSKNEKKNVYFINKSRFENINEIQNNSPLNYDKNLNMSNCEDHLKKISNHLINQYINDENLISKYFEMLCNIREKTAINMAKSELHRLKSEKHQYSENSSSKKKQKWLLSKLQHEYNEIKFMRKFQKKISNDRKKNLLRQLKHFKMMFVYNTNYRNLNLKKLNSTSNSDVSQKTPLKCYDLTIRNNDSENCITKYIENDITFFKNQKKKLYDLLSLHLELQLNTVALRSISQNANSTRVISILKMLSKSTDSCKMNIESMTRESICSNIIRNEIKKISANEEIVNAITPCNDVSYNKSQNTDEMLSLENCVDNTDIKFKSLTKTIVENDSSVTDINKTDHTDYEYITSVNNQISLNVFRKKLLYNEISDLHNNTDFKIIFSPNYNFKDILNMFFFFKKQINSLPKIFALFELLIKYSKVINLLGLGFKLQNIIEKIILLENNLNSFTQLSGEDRISCFIILIDVLIKHLWKIEYSQQITYALNPTNGSSYECNINEYKHEKQPLPLIRILNELLNNMDMLYDDKLTFNKLLKHHIYKKKSSYHLSLDNLKKINNSYLTLKKLSTYNDKQYSSQCVEINDKLPLLYDQKFTKIIEIKTNIKNNELDLQVNKTEIPKINQLNNTDENYQMSEKQKKTLYSSDSINSPINVETSMKVFQVEEAEELRKKQLAIEMEIKALLEQQTPQLPYFMVREIPNKPPPPYIPPSDDAKQKMSLDSIVSNYIIENEEIKKTIKICYENIWTPHLSNEYSNRNEAHIMFKNYCTIFQKHNKQPINIFLFDICNEIFNMEYGDINIKKNSWEYKKHMSQIKINMCEVIESLIIQYLDVTVYKDNIFINCAHKIQDHVDELLIKELQDEEAEWVNVEEYEIAIKNSVTDCILNSMIIDVVKEIKILYQI